jgi:SAM-dependent methyltransferase
MANRYPVLFAECTRHCAGLARPKLLSFGCSSGEEVFTLAQYMPQADIVGVDINDWCLAECRRKDIQHRHTFHHRRSAEYEREQGFDAIFCLAVFQHSDNRSNADNSVAVGHTFEQFEQNILLLDAKLKPGGLFIIEYADFRFTDTACAARYTPLDFPKNRLLRRRPLYGPDNRKLADQHDSPRIFVKQG